MRNFSLGVSARDAILFLGAIFVALGITVVWLSYLEEPIGSLWVGNEQRINKYFLTIVLFGLAGLVALVSLRSQRRRRTRPGLQALLPALMMRFGLALMFVGTVITPIALVYAGDPTRSVPIGFAAFSTIFVGLFAAGMGANLRQITSQA